MSKHKILVVDDEPGIRETIAELLTFYDYEVEVASDGKEALVKIQQFRPELVICDWMMPGISGIEVLQETRGCLKMGNVPFIFLSAKTERENVRLAMSLGADDYITKPFTSAELVDAVASKLKRFADFKEALKEMRQSLPRHFTKYGFLEFNSPVNAIIGGLDFLLEHDVLINHEERRDVLSNLHLAATRLKRTHTNLMLYAKIMRGDPYYSNNYSCSISEAAEMAMKRIHLFDPEIKVHHQIEDVRVGLRVEAVETLLYELIDNALKFGDHDRPPSVMGSKLSDESIYRITIQDFGKGLTSEEISQIGPMVQFNRAKDEQQGWGLGLFLVKSICEAKGLGFGIESSPKGTCVTVDFPIS